MFRGKKYQESAKLIDKAALYDTAEAMELVVKTAPAKFDETVELHVKLGVDSRHADQQVRGAIVLPHGTGKTVRVLAICKGDAAKDAEAAGAEFVGAEDMIQKIQSENWMDFDVLITTPDMMGLVGRLGKILGPRGLMPNPKAGTVTREIGKLSPTPRPVRSSTVSTRPTSSTALSARFPSARRSCRRTSTLCSARSSRRSLPPARASISVPASSPPRWAPASASIPARSADFSSDPLTGVFVCATIYKLFYSKTAGASTRKWVFPACRG